MATHNESFPPGTYLGSGPRCQDTTLRGAEAQIMFETASKQSNDPPFSRVNTLRNEEDNMELKELMDLCTKLPEKGPVVQGKGSIVLVESHHTPTSAPLTLPPLSSSPYRRTTRQEVVVPQPRSPTQTNVADKVASTGVDVRHGGAANTTKLLTLENHLQQIKKVDGEEDMLKYDQDPIFLVQQDADVQGKAKEITLLAQIAEDRRNKPLTKLIETYMSQYIKNMGSHTLKQLKSYSFDEIKNLFETTMRRVHTFVPMDSESERVILELAARSSKRDAEEELVQESSKRLKDWRKAPYQLKNKG
ncbi:hypothetical protein Tco_0132622 [Tanacetum coccineum]